MRIWITRARPEAEATAERLTALGHEPLVAPVLEVRAAEGDGPDLKGVGALAFTSRNGVRAFAALSPDRSLPAFTVGEATAGAARRAGFDRVESAGGDVAALAQLIAARRSAFEGEVLYAAPETPAGDLPAALAERGVGARAEVVYRTALLDPSAAVTAALADGGLDAVLVHSAKAAGRLAECEALRAAASQLAVYAISEAALAPLKALGFREALAAPHPDEASLLGLLPAPGDPPGPRKLFTPLYWAMIAFAMLCILGAVGVASLGPRLFPVGASQPAARLPPPAASNPGKIGLRPRSPRGPP
jgi:uroporphyrinogen-III synthase